MTSWIEKWMDSLKVKYWSSTIQPLYQQDIRQIDRFMDGQMDRLIDDQLDRKMDGQFESEILVLHHPTTISAIYQVDRQMNRRMDVWIDRLMDRWKDKQTRQKP